MSSVRRFITVMTWSWIGLGVVSLIGYVVLVAVYGASTALFALPLALTGVLFIVVMGVFGPIQLAKFPPASRTS